MRILDDEEVSHQIAYLDIEIDNWLRMRLFWKILFYGVLPSLAAIGAMIRYMK